MLHWLYTMNLYEYQAKKIFSKYNIPVLNGWVCTNISEIERCVKNMTGTTPPWVVKCQIHAGGRGQSGGILVTYSLKEVLSFASQWIGNRLVTSQTTEIGEIVNAILIEPAVNIVREFYFSILVDKNTCQFVCMVSIQGGINIEKTIQESPDLLFKITIDPEIGAYPYQGRIIACQLGLTGIQIEQFVKIFINVIKLFIEKDLTLIEINPFAITGSNNLICLDAKVIVDHNALFRQLELLNNLKKDNKSIVQDYDTNLIDVNYVTLDGNIGCMVNGAGLAMATMDLMQSLGGRPANFLDIGGDTNKQCIVSALKMLLNNTKVKAIFINIFGGIVCCDLVANSVIDAVSEDFMNHIPIVVRLEGNNAALGTKRLIDNHLNIFVINNLIQAIQKVITLVK